MTDRELLELAAKAAGHALIIGDDGKTYIYGKCLAGCPHGSSRIYEEDCQAPDCLEELPWNPLTDDGDALRLAVKLEISVSYDAEYPTGKALTRVGGHYDSTLYADIEYHNGDPYAATRLAILRAAAEIERNKHD